jgi:hypothetical protein
MALNIKLFSKKSNPNNKPEIPIQDSAYYYDIFSLKSIKNIHSTDFHREVVKDKP